MEQTILQTLLQEHTPRYVDFLKDICNFEATAYDKTVLDALVDFLEVFARQEGFSTRRTPFDRCGDFLTVEWNPGKEKAALFMAHMDTVHPKGAFGSPAVRIEEDRMIGPGTIDCKGGIAVALLVMKVCREMDYPYHLRLILTSDEEVSNILGGQQELDFFRDESQGFPWAINCEVAEGNQAVVSRKGILRQRIDIQGRSGHSGISYFDCASAVREAAYKIIALENQSIPGGNTYNCGIVRGGTSANIVPDQCSITIDARVATPEDLEQAKKAIGQVADHSHVAGTKASITTLSIRPPMPDNSQTQDLYHRLDRISRQLGMGPLEQIHSGGGSDSAYTVAAGIPSICGMGPWGEFCHNPREYVYIPSIPQRANLLLHFLLEKE